MHNRGPHQAYQHGSACQTENNRVVGRGEKATIMVRGPTGQQSRASKTSRANTKRPNWWHTGAPCEQSAALGRYETTLSGTSPGTRCRVVTRVRGDGRDHGGLGPGREGDETLTLFGPVVLGAALTRKSSGASHEQQNTRERGKGRERERERERETKLRVY